MTEDHQPRPGEDRRAFAEEAESLLRITFAPFTWAAHFVLCYGLASLSCVKGLIPIGPTLAGLVVSSIVALALIAWLGWRSLAQWGVWHTRRHVHDEGCPEDRHRFLGHAAFLLSIISFIGVIFVTLPLLVIGGCL